MPTLKVRVTGAKEAVEQKMARIMDLADEILGEEAGAAVLRIQFDGFGAQTGAPGARPLRVRSGEGLASMRSKVDRISKFHVRAEYGALDATPEVSTYLRTHEGGWADAAFVTIRSTTGGKLAFPPGDAGPPIRDERGVQQFTAREFRDVKDAYGYAALVYTENAILGRRTGPRSKGVSNLDLLFIRRDSVTISARNPIGVQEQITRDKVVKRLTAVLGA